MNFRMKAVSLSLIASAALMACGGGDSNDAVAPTTPTSPVANTVGAAAIAPTANPVTGAEATGNLNYAVTKQDGTSEVAPATSVYNGTNGTLTLYPADAAKKVTLATTDNWNNLTWSGAATFGALRGSGNALQICPTSGAAQVALSHNMVRVTDLTALRGKTFEAYACAATGATKHNSVTFNADGTATPSDGGSVTTQEVAAVFSDAGLTDSKGNITKLVAYSLTRTGLPTRYFLRELGNDKATGGSQRVQLHAEVEI